eukprot:1192306-Prorocentrum_minimum.AAC.3
MGVEAPGPTVAESVLVRLALPKLPPRALAGGVSGTAVFPLGPYLHINACRGGWTLWASVWTLWASVWTLWGSVWTLRGSVWTLWGSVWTLWASLWTLWASRWTLWASSAS